MTHLTRITNPDYSVIPQLPEGSSPITLMAPDIIAKIGLFLTPTENIRLLGTCRAIRNCRLEIERDFRISCRAEVNQFLSYAGISATMTPKERSDIEQLINDLTLQNTKQVKSLIKKILIGSLGNLKNEDVALIKNAVSKFPSNHLRNLFEDILEVITKIQEANLLDPVAKDDALCDFCNRLVNQQRFFEAVLVANQIANEKKRTPSFNNILSPLQAQQKFDEAVAIIQITLDPFCKKRAFWNVAEALIKYEKFEKAIEIADNLEPLNAAGTLENIALALIAHQKYDKVSAVADKISRIISSHTSSILNRIALALAAQQQFEEANKVASKIPDDAERKIALQQIFERSRPILLKIFDLLKGFYWEN